MALLTALSISQISDLESEASNFQDHALELQSITNSMFDLIDSTTGSWQGNAHDAFVKKFDNLRDEMDHIFNMTMDYVSDLMEIAANYRAAEDDNTGVAQGLADGIQLLDY